MKMLFHSQYSKIKQALWTYWTKNLNGPFLKTWPEILITRGRFLTWSRNFISPINTYLKQRLYSLWMYVCVSNYDLKFLVSVYKLQRLMYMEMWCGFCSVRLEYTVPIPKRILRAVEGKMLIESLDTHSKWGSFWERWSFIMREEIKWVT